MPEVQVNLGAMRRYMPAVLKSNTNGWYIEYYAYNQITSGLERKRIKLNREKKKSRTFAEFRSIATQMIIQINCQLASGWSPYAVSSTLTMQQTLPVVSQSIPLLSQQIEQQQSAQIVSNLPTKPILQSSQSQSINLIQSVPQQPIYDGSVDMLVLMDKFLTDRGRELSYNTMRSYKSFCNGLRRWILTKYPDLRSNEFSKRIAVEYMDYVLEGNNAEEKYRGRKHADGTISNRTYNNNLKQGRALFSWAVEKCYCEENPFEKIKTKREETKTRILIPENWRNRIREYFEKTNPQYLMICELVHTSLIRPVEISRLQVSMINFVESCIELPANITKNHKERRARLSEELKEMLNKHTIGAKPDDYLFADKCWRCGKVPMSSHTYGNVWEAMRQAIGLPKEMQLYSLRDTGINGMLKAGIDPLSVMQAADHSDLSMTTRYANHTDPELFKKLNELAPKF